MKTDTNFDFSDDDEEDEEEASWQDSYSDLMTDLLAIFVVLFSFAMMSQAISASRASGQQPAAIAEAAVSGQNILSKENLNSLLESINTYIDESGLKGQLSVTDLGDNQILIRGDSSIFFDSGKAEIKPNAYPVLTKISKIFMSYSRSIKLIRIEGHTDNRPIHTGDFDSNWELSTSRAVNVLRELLSITKIPPDKFSAVGYAEFHPIADNKTESGMAKNRRVDFIIETIKK